MKRSLLAAGVTVVALMAGGLVAPGVHANESQDDAQIETCVSYSGAQTDCWERPRWRYEFCYDRAPKQAFLQRYAKGEWRLVKEKQFKRNTGCPPEYPWELKMSRKMKKDGVKRFRWVMQYGSVYAPVYEYFTVSRTSS